MIDLHALLIVIAGGTLALVVVALLFVLFSGLMECVNGKPTPADVETRSDNER